MFLQIARFELPNELMLPTSFQWFWIQALNRWKEEGLPVDEHIEHYFGFDRSQDLPVNTGLLPRFDSHVLEETPTTQVIIDDSGVKRREFRAKSSAEEGATRGMSQWLEFPVRDRKSWNEFKKRLDPHSPARFPLYWDDLVKQWKNRNYPLGIWAGRSSVSFYGVLRDWIGMENFAFMFHDNPSLVHEMMEYLEYFFLEILSKVLADVDLDYLGIWEDMAYKTASLISPAHFREFMLPHYRRITDFVRSKGVDVIWVDCDGNVDELIPLYMEGGVNGILPLEAAASMNAVVLRKKYGKNLFLVGNIDKRALARGKHQIDDEIEKKVPLLLSGSGYFPAVDHAVPPDVSFGNYLYYLQKLRKVTGSIRPS
jgi:uroporphyrinogen decarboxylase